METIEQPTWAHKGFDIVGGNLKDAMKVAFTSPYGDNRLDTAKGWSLEEREGKPTRLIFHQYESSSVEMMSRFIVPAGYKHAAKVAQEWLDVVEYPEEPGTDGSTDRSHRVYCEGWGHVGDDWTAFVAVEPRWLVYGK